jgi:hypothetical protein
MRLRSIGNSDSTTKTQGCPARALIGFDVTLHPPVAGTHGMQRATWAASVGVLPGLEGLVRSGIGAWPAVFELDQTVPDPSALTPIYWSAHVGLQGRFGLVRKDAFGSNSGDAPLGAQVDPPPRSGHPSLPLLFLRRLSGCEGANVPSHQTLAAR